MKPKRIQRKRVKGWKMPPNTVYVGRPTKWGNPFVAEKDGQNSHDYMHTFSAKMAVDSFRRTIVDGWSSIPCHKWPKRGGHLLIPREFVTIEDVKRELRGKDLACWCPLDQPCHADVLLEIANAEPEIVLTVNAGPCSLNTGQTLTVSTPEKKEGKLLEISRGETHG